MNKISILLITFCLGINTLKAQTPQKLSYQAVIRNSNGQLIINSTVGVKISILSNSNTGTVVYSEINNATTNSNGLFTLLAVCLV